MGAAVLSRSPVPPPAVWTTRALSSSIAIVRNAPNRLYPTREPSFFQIEEINTKQKQTNKKAYESKNLTSKVKYIDKQNIAILYNGV